MSEQVLEQNVQVAREAPVEKPLRQVKIVLNDLLTNYLDDVDSPNVKACIAELFKALDAVPRWHDKQIVILSNGRILYRQDGQPHAQETIRSQDVKVIEQREIDEALEALNTQAHALGRMVPGVLKDWGAKLKQKADVATDTFYHKTLAGETAEDICLRLLPILLKHLEQERQIKMAAPALRPRRSYWPVIETNCAQLFAELTSITTCKAVVAVQIDSEQVLFRSGQIKRLDHVSFQADELLTLPPGVLDKIHQQPGAQRTDGH